MRVIVIGAVAAGTSAAAKARRNSETDDIVLYEKDTHISYSGCGMPYFLGGEVEKAEALTPRDPAFFKSKYNLDVHTAHEVLAIHPEIRRVTVKNLETGEAFEDRYDKLVIATGAASVRLPLEGMQLPHVFTLRNISDMMRIQAFMDESRPKTAVIIGTGFIGLEMCESLKERGLAVTLIEKLPQVTPGLDPDMAAMLEKHLRAHGVQVLTGASVQAVMERKVPEFEGADAPTYMARERQMTVREVVLADGTAVPADLVLVAAGVRPNVALAKAAGIALGDTGAIRVNERMETNISDVYACGDCIEQTHLVTGKPVWVPLGSTANKTGRIAGDNLSGGALAFRGILGTGIFRVLGLTVARTGLSEREALQAGFEVVTSLNIKPARPEYMGGKEITIKSVADKDTGRLLGAQILGAEGVDKRIDVLATAITFGAKAADLFHLDLAYAPPFSTTKDPVMYTGMILDNALRRGRPLMTVSELEARVAAGEKVQIVDARVAKQFDKAHVEGAVNLPHDALRDGCTALDPDVPTITYCNKGTTGNAAQNILKNKGFKEVYNLSGGHRAYLEKP